MNNLIKISIVSIAIMIISGCSSKEEYMQGYKDGSEAGYNQGVKVKNLKETRFKELDEATN